MRGFKDFTTSCITDLETWWLDYDIDSTLFRMWMKGEGESFECDYVYITHVVELPNRCIMIGVQEYDNRYKDFRYPSITYYMLDEVRLSVSECDEDYDGEDTTND